MRWRRWRQVGPVRHVVVGRKRLWEHGDVTNPEPTIEELEATIAALREEIARLREEIRRSRRDDHEVPPHYL